MRLKFSKLRDFKLSLDARRTLGTAHSAEKTTSKVGDGGHFLFLSPIFLVERLMQSRVRFARVNQGLIFCV